MDGVLLFIVLLIVKKWKVIVVLWVHDMQLYPVMGNLHSISVSHYRQSDDHSLNTTSGIIHQSIVAVIMTRRMQV